MKIRSLEFEIVEEFRYMGAVVNGLSKKWMDMEQRIQTGNRACFVYKDTLKNKVRCKIKMRNCFYNFFILRRNS